MHQSFCSYGHQMNRFVCFSNRSTKYATLQYTHSRIYFLTFVMFHKGKDHYSWKILKTKAKMMKNQLVSEYTDEIKIVICAFFQI